MLNNLKALMVVLPVALVVFALAKPICLQFVDEKDFVRRRNVWIVLTLVAFTSPSFWLFVAVAMPLLVWGAHKDSNPVALYLLVMNTISPNIRFEIPVVGIESLFELNIHRILIFAIIVPEAWRLIRSPRNAAVHGLKTMDGLIVAWGILQLLLFMPYESLTNTMRRGFLFSIDIVVLYYVVSRACTSRRAIIEAMIAFCLASAVYAPLAAFESAKGWLLYWEIGGLWGDPPGTSYLFRSDTLRAQVSAGHALSLGYMMSMAFGFWLYLRSIAKPPLMGNAGTVWMLVGLLAAYSRGPWVACAVTFFAYFALGPKGTSRLFKVSLISALIGGLVVVSPIGERVIANLPFVGAVDTENIAYRQQLAIMSWELIQRNPLFGNPFVLLHLEELRQGEGIIDLVNSYAAIAMYHGLVGLILFLGPFGIGMWNVYRTARRSALSIGSVDLSFLGSSLLACMAGTLTMMATGSFAGNLEVMFYVLTGLAAGYLSATGSEAPLQHTQYQERRPEPRWKRS